jgi:homogentisate 1,2-dioxygenase
MLDRMAAGELPAKHHIQLREGGRADGALRYEHCITRDGFEGPYTIAYHLHRPHLQQAAQVDHGHPLPVSVGPRALRKRHFLTQQMRRDGGPAVDARTPLMFNADVTIGVSFPDADDPIYYVNGDADELVFIYEGGGTLRTPLGDVEFEPLDYVAIPRGTPHRFLLRPNTPQWWLHLELQDLHLPRQWRNPSGQLRMDAPYCHRDFRRPRFEGPRDDGVRHLLVKRGGAFHGFVQAHSLLDVVGWDGSVYPWAFPILAFQPRAGLVHLPPTWHGTFASRGALTCSFVPRMVDFHPESIPCPYPHSSVDVDEFLFYARGNFTSRRGVGEGSISFHPAGLPHGPHPGAYEASIGTTRTDELAVMLDCLLPLEVTTAAAAVEDAAYHDSFLG